MEMEAKKGFGVKSERQKYQTVAIILRDERARELAVNRLMAAPIDPLRPLELVLREEVKQRGLDQNGLYWKRLSEIAEQAWQDGRTFNSDSWHYYCGRHVMPDIITTKDGVERSKWVESPGGELSVISTTQLERGCFAEYTSLVEVFGCSLGVKFSANPRDGRG